MKKLLSLALLLLLSNFGQAQTTGPGFVIYVGSAPSGTCSAGAYQENVIGLGTVYTCQSGTWTQISGGGGGSGTVTSIATTTPITGGTITATGTIACATCVKATSPGAGIAHFAGSTQEVTSSLIVAADITSGTITGTQIASSVALAGSPTTTTQSASDNSTKVATTAYVDRVASAMVKLESHTASSSASLSFTTCLGTAGYSKYLLLATVPLRPATNNVNLQLTFASDSSSLYDYAAWRANSGGGAASGTASNLSSHDTKIILDDGGAVGNTANFGIDGSWTITPGSATAYTRLFGEVSQIENGSTFSVGTTHGMYESNTAPTTFQVLFSSGNITTGTLTCYGITP